MSFCRRCIEAVVRLRGKCQFELSHASEPIARPRVIPHGGVQRRFFASSLLWPLSSIQQRRCFSAGAGLAEGDTAYQSVVTIAKLSEDAAKDVSEELLELGVCSSLERDEDCKKGDELFQWQDQKSLWSSSRLVSFFESGDDEEIMQTLERGIIFDQLLCLLLDDITDCIRKFLSSVRQRGPQTRQIECCD
mmetsp:Transcript_9270/g.23810  ORF Transcript_9270/g.23810 Transcript_9270/m.23810 type:complete len:191 (-) Transcript_9270:604-1176(-)